MNMLKLLGILSMSSWLIAGQPLNFETTVSPANCTAAQLGSILVTVTGGSAPYTVKVIATISPLPPTQVGNGPNFSFQNLRIDDYEVTVTDTSVPAQIVNKSVSVPLSNLGIELPIVTTPSNCSSPLAIDGSITVTALGGILPYSFSIDDGPLSVSQGSPVFDFFDVATGDHTVAVVDGNLCRSEAIVGVDSSTLAIELPIETTLSNCSSLLANDGSITITALGGISPYSFSIDAGPFSVSQDSPVFDFSDVASGDHTVVVEDGNLCRREELVSVTMSTLQAIASSTPSFCSSAGAQDGTVTVDLSGGLSPYTVQVGDDLQVGESAQVQFVFDGLNAGSYDMIATDGVSCQRSDTVKVEMSTLGFTTETIPQTSPAGGIIIVTVTGGQSSDVLARSEPMPAVVADPFVVTVGDQTQAGFIGQTEFIFIELQYGEYKVTCSDEFGCVRSRNVLLLSDNDLANFFLIKYCSSGEVT